MDDIMTLVCTRPAVNQTVTVQFPPAVVSMLQTLADSVMVPDPYNPGQMKHKYAYAANVIWADVIAMLVPFWQQSYLGIATAAEQAQIEAIQNSVQDTLRDALASITVVGP